MMISLLKVGALVGPPLAWVAVQSLEPSSLAADLKESAPTLVAMVTVIGLLLTYMAKRDKEFSETIREESKKQRELQHDTVSTLRETNTLLGRVVERLHD